MKKSIAAALLAVFALNAYAATAFWTGRMEQVQTVTYQFAWRCEYNYAGRTFWQIHQSSCPNSVEVF